MTDWMIYGANGYTGELIAREATMRGLRPVLAGRNAAQIETLAAELGLSWRAFALSAPDLAGVGLVLHCAGPFVHTSRPMVDACLEARAHYLDITGEIAVFESIYARDAEARGRGIALIPGVGFDVVPTDCIAAQLASRLPGANELWLAFSTSRGSSASRGTLRTMVEGLGRGGAVRRGGRIVNVPTAFDVATIPFASGPREAMTIPWGDVSSAWRSTGIPDIRVYSAASRKSIARARRLSRIEWLLRFMPVKAVARRIVSRSAGPSPEQRERGRVDLWGRVSDGLKTETMTMSTPDGYAFTVSAALAATSRVLSASGLEGSLTPSQAFGAEFAESLPGVHVGGSAGVAASER